MNTYPTAIKGERSWAAGALLLEGESPQQFFRTTAADAHREGNTPVGQSAGPNFFGC